MITQPSIPRLLEAIRDELNEKIKPAVNDATTVVAIDMMTAVLSALAVRAENEIAWMLEECEAIEAAAGRLAPALPDRSRLDEALAALQATRAGSMRLSAVAEQYAKACEVLSRLAEAAYAAGDRDAIATVEELIDARLATEQAAIGTFIAVGRD